MFTFYVISGLVGITIITIVIIWFVAKRAGRKAEQFKNMKEDLKNGKEVNKIKSGNVNKPIAAIRKRLLKRIKN